MLPHAATVNELVTAAVEAGGNRHDIESLLSLILTAWCSLEITSQDMMGFLAVGYIRGFALSQDDPKDEESHQMQAKRILQAAAQMKPELSEVFGLLGEYLERYLYILREQRDVARHLFHIIRLMNAKTEQMNYET